LLRSFNLVQRDLRLGLKGHCFRYARFFPSCLVVGPHLGKIQAEGDRHAGALCRDGKANGYPAVILFAHLAAVLARAADRVLSLLWKPCIVHHPGNDRSLPQHGGKHGIQRSVQQNFVIPRGIRHQMMQRLMHPANVIRIQTRRHRFDALALPRQQQSRAVRLEGTDPICVSGRLRQAIEICSEPFLLWAWRSR